MKNYRKLYEQYHQCSLLTGIDIHHIDGNHDNNDPKNLQAVTLEEHYQLHKEKNEYYAAYMIGTRMKIKPQDWEEMAKQNGKKAAIQNKMNGVGLLAWVRNNPELVKKMRSDNGKKSGRIAVEQNLGIHSLTPERKKQIAATGGKRAAELGLGFKAGYASEAGKKGGKKGGQYAKENKTGIFALTPEQIKAKALKGAITRLINNGKACAWPRKENL